MTTLDFEDKKFIDSGYTMTIKKNLIKEDPTTPNRYIMKIKEADPLAPTPADWKTYCEDGRACISEDNTSVEWYDHKSLGATEFLKTIKDGILIRYESSIPSIIDISSFLSDNMVKVWSGGTITAVNDFNLPIPWAISYVKPKITGGANNA